MGLALLFPGQGTQHAQMLAWLDAQPEARPTLQAMAAMVGPDWRRRLDDAHWTTVNAVAQPLLTGLALAAWQCIAPSLPAPAVVAGYSVGELAAFSAAGVFDARTALQLASIRAACMDRSANGVATGLLAVRNLPSEALTAWCERHGLALAIRLGPDRAIVGGTSAALEAAVRDPRLAGGEITPIAVRVASHTPWMRAAADQFGGHLATLALAMPSAPLVCNLTGAASRRPPELARCLAQQIASPVLWDSCMESVAERQVRCVLEVGPGTTLSSMWRAAYPHIPARSVDEFRSPQAAAGWAMKLL